MEVDLRDTYQNFCHLYGKMIGKFSEIALEKSELYNTNNNQAIKDDILNIYHDFEKFNINLAQMMMNHDVWLYELDEDCEI